MEFKPNELEKTQNLEYNTQSMHDLDKSSSNEIETYENNSKENINSSYPMTRPPKKRRKLS